MSTLIQIMVVLLSAIVLPVALAQQAYSECFECVSIPLMVATQDQGMLMSNIILNPGDDYNNAIDEICRLVGGDINHCIKSVRAMAASDSLVGALAGRLQHSDKSLSRHEVFTISNRLRKFPIPRRLIVLGATKYETELWHLLNTKLMSGYTAFGNRENFGAEGGGWDPTKIFVHTPVEVEMLLGNVIPRVHSSLADSSADMSSNCSRVPWDVSLVFLEGLCGAEPDKYEWWEHMEQGTNEAFLPTLALCREISGPCTRRRMCMQAYVNYAESLVSDDGYVFFVLPRAGMQDGSSIALSSVNFHRLEQRFLYRHQLSAHIDSSSSVLFYTSQEKTSTLTRAGRLGRVESRAAREILSLTQCMASKAFQGHVSDPLDIVHSVKRIAENGSSQVLTEKMQLALSAASSNAPSRSLLARLMRRRGYSRVVGILFCCRRRYSQILIPYLQKALVAAGGIVDHFLVVNLGSDDDDPGFPEAVASLPGFSEMAACKGSRKFACAYTNLGAIDHKALFVKIDDDILFVADNTFEFLVWEKLTAPRGVLVHGNGVNHMHAPFFHTALPFAQKLQNISMALRNCCTSSLLGSNDCPEVFDNPMDGAHADNPLGYEGNTIENFMQTLQNITCLQREMCCRVSHRVERYEAALSFAFYGRDWQSADVANSQHLLFLDVMRGQLDALLGAGPGGALDDSASTVTKYRQREMAYWFHQVDMNACSCTRPQPGYGYCSARGFYRTSINFVAFDWSDISPHLDLIEANDEFALTVLIPERTGLGQRLCGKCLYAHAAFTPQRLGTTVKFDESRILQAYQDLAKVYLSL